MGTASNHTDRRVIRTNRVTCARELPVVDEREAIRAGLGLLIFAALLPLQWDSLVSSSVGTLRYFHVGAAALVLLGAPAIRSHWNHLRVVSFPIVPAFFVSSAALTMTAIVFGGSLFNAIQALVYLVVGVAASACFLSALQHEGARGMVAQSGGVATLLALGGMWRGFRDYGVDLFGAYAQAAQGQQGLLLHGFRLVFEQGDESLRSQARHEVFGALLVAALLSYAVGTVSRVGNVIRFVATAAILVLIVLSLSRALLLAMALMAVLPLARVCVSGRLSRWSVPLGIGVVVGGFLAWDFVSGLVSGRLSDTRSYEGRLNSLDAFAAQDVVQRLLLGGGPLPVSTHNMVLDGLLLGGVIAGLASALVALRVIVLVGSGLGRFAASGSYLDAAATAAGMVAIVRMATSGGGQLHLVSWVAIGLLLAATVRSKYAPSAHRDHSLFTTTRDPARSTVGASPDSSLLSVSVSELSPIARAKPTGVTATLVSRPAKPIRPSTQRSKAGLAAPPSVSGASISRLFKLQ